MTPERAKYAAPFIQMFANREPFQIRYRLSGIGWRDANLDACHDFEDPNTEFRIKPEPKPPKYRAWKRWEVPVGALIRRNFKPESVSVIIGVIDERGIVAPEIGLSYYVADWFTYHGGHNGDRVEHSTDGGKTWAACGVLVQEEAE